MRNPITGKNIVIIGSGIGGLSAGILLSDLQFNVTVVEKNPVPGGLMRSYQRGGMDCPVGVHYVGALGGGEPLNKMFQILGIDPENIFYRMGKQGVIDRYIFDDFTFDLPAGIDAYEHSLRAACPEDGAALDSIFKNLRDIAARMMTPQFLISQADPFSDMDYLRPMGEFLDEISASPRLRAVLAVPCQLVGVELSDCPIIFHHMVAASYLFSAWRPKEGGAPMTNAFVSRFLESGGSLMLKETVRKVHIENGKVQGVQLSSGVKLSADGVVAAIHPKAMLEMLSPGDLRPSLQERIRTLDETHGVLAVQVSVDAAAHPELDYNIYRLHADRRGFIEDGIFYQIRKGNLQSRNLLSIITRSPYEDWRVWEGTRTGRRGAAYEDRKMAAAQSLMSRAEKVIGPLRNARILDVFTPLTLRDYVNCPEGSCYGILRSSRQLLKMATLLNLPVGGLCLAGQNALAPGVMGSILGSFAAVRQIIGPSRFAGIFHTRL